MKTKLKLITGLMTLCGTLATTAAFGQATQIWTGGGDGTNLAVAANWGGTLPSTANNDTGEWNGTVLGNLVLYYNPATANFQSGPGSSGVNFYLAGTQTGSIQFKTTTAAPSYLAITDITLDPGAGSLIIGDTNAATRLDVIGRPSGAVHPYVNNSTSPAIINPRVRFAAGGGAVWTMDFSGTGNWYCTNQLCNDNGPAMTIQLDGPGNMYWNPSAPNVYQSANGISSPIVINAGMLVLEGNHPKLGSQAFTLGGTFDFNAPGQAQTLTGVFSGGGTNIIAGGTLTLSGQNSYAGDTVLSGGEVVANGAENPGTSGPLGVGIIDFNGGTLGYSLNNTADYSSRFNTGANQAYSIDTAGQNVTFATGLSSSGGTLTKVGSGTLTLAGGSTYSGLTTVSLGKLVFQGTKSGSASITVADGAALGIVENGSQIKPGLLAVGTSTGATLEFNNVTNLTAAPLAAGSITAVGPITVNINSGSFKTIGQQFPLFSWSSGSAPAVTLGAVSGAAGTLSTNGNQIVLTITSTPYVWSGANNGSWDTSTAGNWLQSGNPVIFANGTLALLDDTATGVTNLTLGSTVLPATVTVNNSLLPYSIASSTGNAIGGTASLTKNGSGSLTLSGGANTYTGVTTINNGIVSVGTLANSGTASDIGEAGSSAANLVLNGGTLQYTGTGASIDHSFTLGPSSGALDASGSGPLNLTNKSSVVLSGSGPHTLTLTGTGTVSNTLALNIVNSSGGATALTKDSTTTWVLTGTNTYSGLTTINNGVLQIGAGGANGTIGSGNILDERGLDFDLSSSVTVGGLISGTGSVTNDGVGTVILTGNDTYSGGTTINAGVLQVGNGGASGKLYPNASVVINNAATFIFDSTTPLGINGYLTGIQGTGNLIVRPGCFLSSIDDNTYTGWTEIDAGATFQPCTGNEGQLYSSVVTNNGTLLLVRQDAGPAVFGYTNDIVGTGKVVKENNNANTGWVTLAGTNTYTGGTWIAGGGIVIGDGLTIGAGSIVGTVWFTNTVTAYQNARQLIFERADNFTFTNNIISVVTDGSAVANSGSVEQSGPGTVAITGNNSYPGGTTIDSGMVLQVGNGGTSGSIGNGAVTDNGELDVNLTSPFNFTNAISGAGILVQLGSGTTTLNGTLLTYTGSTTVSNGTLVLASSTVSVGGDLDIEGGTLVSGGAGVLATNNVGGSFNLDAGTVVVAVDTVVAQSNTFFNVASAISATGGRLKLANVGPALHAGQKFTLFSGPVSGGAAVALVSPGVTFNNNLAADGSVTVATVAPAPTLTTTVSGGNLNLAWPAVWTGLHVQSQTNTLAKGLGTNWVTIPGTDASNSYSAPINPTAATVFYRLAP